MAVGACGWPLAGAQGISIWGEAHFLKILFHLGIFVCFERGFRSKFYVQSGHKTLCAGMVRGGEQARCSADAEQTGYNIPWGSFRKRCEQVQTALQTTEQITY